MRMCVDTYKYNLGKELFRIYFFNYKLQYLQILKITRTLPILNHFDRPYFRTFVSNNGPVIFIFNLHSIHLFCNIVVNLQISQFEGFLDRVVYIVLLWISLLKFLFCVHAWQSDDWL